MSKTSALSAVWSSSYFSCIHFYSPSNDCLHSKLTVLFDLECAGGQLMPLSLYLMSGLTKGSRLKSQLSPLFLIQAWFWVAPWYLLGEWVIERVTMACQAGSLPICTLFTVSDQSLSRTHERWFSYLGKRPGESLDWESGHLSKAGNHSRLCYEESTVYWF